MKSVSTSKTEEGERYALDVRLQWDPDHDPFVYVEMLSQCIVSFIQLMTRYYGTTSIWINYSNLNWFWLTVISNS